MARHRHVPIDVETSQTTTAGPQKRLSWVQHLLIWSTIAASLGGVVTVLLALGVIRPFGDDRQSAPSGVPPTPSVSHEPGPTSSSPSSQALQILSPPPGVSVPRCVVVTASGNVPQGHRLWAGVYTDGPPERNWLLRLLELRPSQDGTLSAPGLNVGDAGNITKQFRIFIALVPDDVSRDLESKRSDDRVYDEAWLKQNKITKPHEITVQRQPDTGKC